MVGDIWEFRSGMDACTGPMPPGHTRRTVPSGPREINLRKRLPKREKILAGYMVGRTLQQVSVIARNPDDLTSKGERLFTIQFGRSLLVDNVDPE